MNIIAGIAVIALIAFGAWQHYLDQKARNDGVDEEGDED